MIPKKIHYCWFGKNPLPDKFQEFVDGWKRLNPDYEIVWWNEKNSPIKEPYLWKALRKREWSNASNFMRLWAIYNEGGIYMDTDFMLVKPLDSLLNNDIFYGFQTRDVNDTNCINNAFFGAIQGHPFVKLCLDGIVGLYDGLETSFLSGPHLSTFLLKTQGKLDYDRGQLNDIRLYPTDFFYPFSWDEEFSESCITDNTIGVHFWDASWAK